MSNLLLYIIVVVIWGSTWIAITFQLGEVAPVVSIIYRFGFAALLLFIFCLLKKVNLTLNRTEHFQVALLGMTLFGSNYYLIYHAQQYINSALTCIACSLILVFNIVNARLFFGTKLTPQIYVGGLLGLIGISLLFWPEVSHLTIDDKAVLGFILCVGGTLLASFGNMISIRNNQIKLPIMPANAWGMLYGALFMTLIALLNGETFSFSFSVTYIGSLLFLSIFGSVIAFGCYLTLLNNIGAHKASYTTIMFPAVAVVISTFVEDFNWNIYAVIGLIFILVGNLVVLGKKPKIKKQLKKKYSSETLLQESSQPQ